MVEDHPLAMEEPSPLLSSVLSPPEIEKGTIEIEELPPPAKSKHQGATNNISSTSSAVTRRAWMPSRPRQVPHHQGNKIINVKEQDEKPLHRMRKDDRHKEMHLLPEEQHGRARLHFAAQHQQQLQQQHDAVAASVTDDDPKTSTSLPLNNYNHGSKPKLSNMSLLSSAVAYATLERCLLGRNGGERDHDGEDDDEEEDAVNLAADGLQPHPNANSSSTALSSSSSLSLPPTNYSKQCKEGHVIDILELRRLSSRGVPDEPPEIRTAAHYRDSENDGTHPSSSSPPIPPTTTTSMGLSHRSYRPLVWRVLLGYLPPQTSLWNMVLDRDRQLYDMLVQELFSSTCPAPHEYHVHEEEMDRTLQHGKDRASASPENQVPAAAATTTTTTKSTVNNGSDFRIDEDDEEECNDVADNIHSASPPRTPTESPAHDTTSANTPILTTPHTPGLLSARMQMEWIRGENGGDNPVFIQNHQPYSNSPGSSSLARISPMCAMNTPRTRIYETTIKKTDGVVGIEEDYGPRTISEDIATELADIEHSSSSSMWGKNTGDVVEGGLSHHLKESLLLPDHDDDEEEEGGNEVTHTIYVNSTTEGGATPNHREETVSKPEDALGMKMLLRGSSSNDSADDSGAIVPTPTPNTRSGVSSAPDNDEEENMLLLDEIRKDVIRTHPDLRFFLEPEEGLGQKRYAALERILFVWAKLNKGVRYVQGMNEIVGTLYFVLAHDSNEEWSNHAEADTYFLFNALMVEMRDVFVPALDEADTGIHGRINNMITLLSLHDPEIRCHLDSVGIDPSFYSVRWLTTLLSREFLLPDTIRLWDSMFASTHKDNFLRYVSVTMVMVIRDQLLSGDFSTCMRLLQAYPPTNLDRLLESSRALWIYESQITLACHKGGISLGHALRSITPPPAIVMAYGLPGGVAPPIRQQVRQVGERGLAAARGAANGASTTVVSAGRNFFGNAMSFWREGSGGSDGRSKSSMGDGI